ncbi:hypothetical protein H639_01104 [Cutibacterium avidum TM16]|uniref:hypothetical protein n=1 Tax=Cutibacterium avidum TaxID=33010 RepID=UPI000390B4BC|nr:hypothetical protein [Cutibacterium avidum]ERF59124.1 hypothetical protein H639_01104 [Cutibacterium avidum TM16]
MSTDLPEEDDDDVQSSHEHDEQSSRVHREGLRDVPTVSARAGGRTDLGVPPPPGAAPQAAQDPLPGTEASFAQQVEQIVEAQISTAWFGPLPAPAVMQEYEQVAHGSADRIIRVHESQTVQVANREDRIVDAAIERDSDGQSFALLLSLVCIVLAAIFGFMGKTAMAGIMLGPPVVMLIGSFIPERRHTQHKDQGTKP